MNEEKTKLSYSIVPASIYYTRDAQNPSVQILSIGVSNTQSEDINIIGFEVRLPVNGNVDDPNAITADASPISAVALQAEEWDFQKVGDGLFRATPIPPVTGVTANASIAFQLKNILVNEAAGACIITIVENDGDGVRSMDHKQVIKIKSELNIDNFTATPADIQSGDPSILAWETTAAARVTLSPGDFPDIKPNDSVIVRPELTKTYTLTAFGEGPNLSRQMTVQVPPPKIADFGAKPDKVNAGDMATLTWDVENASHVSITPGNYKDLPLKSSLNVPVSADTTFILFAGNRGLQTTSAPAEVLINPVNIKLFKTNPATGVQAGNAVELLWEIDSATSAFIQPGGINIQKNQLKKGSWWVTPAGATSYALIAQNTTGQQVKEINVLPMPQNWHLFSSSAPFDSRTIGVINCKNKMWLLTENGGVYTSWDGQNWAKVKSNAPWQPRTGCSVCAFKDKIWLMGGEAQGGCLNDVWSCADGINWIKETASALWEPRKDFGSCVLYDGFGILMAGGMNSNGRFFNNAFMTMDGKNWYYANPNVFPEHGRSGFAMVSTGEVAYVFGGITYSGLLNDVYTTSDGITWMKQANAGWSPRAGLKAAWVNSGIYIGFGLNGEGSLHDLYFMSGNGCFTKKIDTPLGETRAYLVAYQDALWCLGGVTGGVVNKNVYSFNPPAETDSRTYKKHVSAFNVGPEAALLEFFIVCRNIPKDSVAGLYADKAGPAPSLCLIDIKVPGDPIFSTGITSVVPANYSSDITIYASPPQGASFPENASIELSIRYAPGGNK